MPPTGTNTKHADDVVSGRGDKPENARNVHVVTTIFICEETYAHVFNRFFKKRSKRTDVRHLTE